MRNLLLSLSIITLINNALVAQNSTEKELELVQNNKEGQVYLESNVSKNNKFVVFNEEKHKTTLAKELFDLSVGGTKVYENEFEKTFYKIIEKNKIPYYRVSYIYLNTEKYGANELNTLRDNIIYKYNNGTPFDFLAKQYSMDNNATRGGDSGWFTAGDYFYDFEDDIIADNHPLNAVFTLDFPENSESYVIFKTYAPKNISEIKVLKVQENKN